MSTLLSIILSLFSISVSTLFSCKIYPVKSGFLTSSSVTTSYVAVYSFVVSYCLPIESMTVFTIFKLVPLFASIQVLIVSDISSSVLNSATAHFVLLYFSYPNKCIF